MDVARSALAGLLVVVPTDTVYGIAARPDDPTATRRIFEAKGRPRELMLPVLVPSIDAARTVAVFDDRIERFVAQVWPGVVTVVLARTPISAGWDLGGDPETIGVRVPDHAATLAVLERTGPLAVSSANRSGEPTPTTAGGVATVFGDEVGAYLHDPVPASQMPSTVVDLAHGPARILRPGALGSEAVLRLLSND
ncbi:MAG: L-threonylcarbamoyladenylate synthase [Actinomycetota bacterium]